MNDLFVRCASLGYARLVDPWPFGILVAAGTALVTYVLCNLFLPPRDQDLADVVAARDRQWSAEMEVERIRAVAAARLQWEAERKVERNP